MGAFQEERQVLAATPVSKWAHAIEHVNRIPFYVEMAVRQSIYGRPGASYLDIADDMITGSCDTDQVVQVAEMPRAAAHEAMPQDIEKALDVLQSAERPLVLIGQGMASSGAEEEVRAFVEKIQVPFVRTPKGKGIMPDDHPLSAGAARTLALAAGRRRLPDGRSLQLDPAFRPAAALQPERAGGPARHQPRVDAPEQARRGGAARRRQGDHAAAQPGARRAASGSTRKARRGVRQFRRSRQRTRR